MDQKDCKVLILKGNKAVGELTKDFLIKFGFVESNIFLTDDAGQAERYLNSQDVDLIITGIGGAEEEGPVLLKWLEAEDLRDKIKVIFYSGAEEGEIQRKVKKYRADSYIPMPVGFSIFRTAVLEIVETI